MAAIRMPEMLLQRLRHNPARHTDFNYSYSAAPVAFIGELALK